MKNAIVTGAARGIGRVIANRLADDGWRVGLADISIAAIENEEPLRANCVALEADVSKPESIAAALAAFDATPDLLVNNAGIVRFGPLLTLAQSDFESVVNVNLVEGERKRVQAYEGVVIARRNRGLNSSFIVRKISSGEGVERTFQLYSPLLASIEVKRRGDVRRAKLYYLRQRSGKSARIKEKLTFKRKEAAAE